MLHYRTSHTSYHTDMHKWIGAHTCKQDTHRHTLLYTQLIAQILLSCSHEQVSSPEYAQRCTNTHLHSRGGNVLIMSMFLKSMRKFRGIVLTRKVFCRIVSS